MNYMEVIEYKAKNDFNLRLEARLKNGDLVKARENLGLTAKAAASLMDISYCNLIGFENLKVYPSKESQDKILAFYERNGISISKEKVFPEWLRYYQSRKLIAEKSVPPEKIVSLSSVPKRQLPVYESNPAENLDKKLIVENILNSLPEKEKIILEHRFGLNGKNMLSCGELAKNFGVSRERIRQREEYALKISRTKAREFVSVE